jgi:hypothetical protein
MDCYGAEGDHLERIFTGDETLTHYYEPENKHQSMEWKYPHSPAKKKFKTCSTTGKHMNTVFGTLSRDGLNNAQCSLQHDDLNNAQYSLQRDKLNNAQCSLQRDELKPAIQSK